MLPVAYVAIRILTGSSLLIGDFIGIAQSITFFSWDLEWFFDMLLDAAPEQRRSNPCR